MASMSYFYNSVLVESTTDWECWNSSSSYNSLIFSSHGTYRHGQFSYLRDRVELVVRVEDELTGPSQDLQCFNNIKQAAKKPGALGTKLIYISE